jgi:glycosyltransferase involved in cell wall biosynthesis
MRIIFDLRNVGLGHNGGSLTLIKSGNTLHDMGHEVCFIDSGRNQNKWEPLKPPHMRVRSEKQIPDADAIIATGYKSVGPTVNTPSRCGKKFIWIRAWEHWQMSDEKIVKKVLNAPIHKIVNSICLQKKLKQYNVKSDIVRPGYDFEHLYPRSIRRFNPEPIIGGLYREGVHGQRKRTQWLFETVKTLRNQGVKFRFWLMGSEREPAGVDRYLRQPTMEEKNDFYNYVNIWMAPTMSEGLHLPPAEAGLTGCPCVGTNAPLSGLQDYLIHQETGYVAKNNLKSFIDAVDIMLHNPKLRKKYGQNMIYRLHEIGDRKKNMQKMIDVIESLS